MTITIFPLTRDQRLALKRIYERADITATMGRDSIIKHPAPISYTTFRRSAYRPIRKDDCVMVWWKGMWLGIEPDGYTHS